MKLKTFVRLVGALVAVFCAGFFPPQVLADQILVYGWLGGYNPMLRSTNSVGTVNVSEGGITGAFSASASFGRIDVRADSFYPEYPLGPGYATGSGGWDDTITIQPDDPAQLGTPGTAVFTYYLNGSYWGVGLAQFSVSTECGCGGPSTYGGTPIVSSFTITRPFTFGSPLWVQMGLEGRATGDFIGGVDASLTAGGIAVSDSSGTSTAYRSSSSAGSARAAVLTNGDSYAGFSLTNTVGHQTTVALLAGAADSNETLLAAFTGSPGTNGLVSDVVDFSGTDTNLFALQMSYGPAAAIAQLGDEAKTLLMWFNPLNQVWTNAIYGNSDGGATNHFVAGAFDTNAAFQLGNYGVDTIKHFVWAVLDHHSLFAAGGAVAPPSLRCTGILPGTKGVSISLRGPAAGEYFIEKSSDLGTTNWSVLGRAVPDMNGTATFFDATPASANQQRFYRARQ
jgi:hypothetical protein